MIFTSKYTIKTPEREVHLGNYDEDNGSVFMHIWTAESRYERGGRAGGGVKFPAAAARETGRGLVAMADEIDPQPAPVDPRIEQLRELHREHQGDAISSSGYPLWQEMGEILWSRADADPQPIA